MHSDARRRVVAVLALAASAAFLGSAPRAWAVSEVAGATFPEQIVQEITAVEQRESGVIRQEQQLMQLEYQAENMVGMPMQLFDQAIGPITEAYQAVQMADGLTYGAQNNLEQIQAEYGTTMSMQGGVGSLVWQGQLMPCGAGPAGSYQYTLPDGYSTCMTQGQYDQSVAQECSAVPAGQPNPACPGQNINADLARQRQVLQSQAAAVLKNAGLSAQDAQNEQSLVAAVERQAQGGASQKQILQSALAMDGYTLQALNREDRDLNALAQLQTNVDLQRQQLEQDRQGQANGEAQMDMVPMPKIN
jgi:hypothetical protein